MNTTDPVCIPTEAYRLLYGTVIEQRLFQFLFPALAAIGVVCNLLNIRVLTIGEMSRADKLFLVLALCDISFFSILIPSCLASYGPIASNLHFRQLFFIVKTHLTGVANWLSSLNIWTVAFISAERFVAVRHPFEIVKLPGVWKLSALFALVTLLCTGHSHYSTTCIGGHACNGTQMWQACADITLGKTPMGQPNNVSDWHIHLIQTHRYFHSILGLAIPLLAIIVFSLLLIHHACTGGLEFRGTENDGNNQSDGQEERGRRHSSRKEKTTNKEVTRVAAVIIGVFIVTNVPSSILLIVQTHWPIWHIWLGEEDKTSYYAQVACTFLTIVGKASNFAIFCWLSKNFWKRLKDVIFCRAPVTTTMTEEEVEAAGEALFEALARANSRRFNARPPAIDSPDLVLEQS